MGSSMGSGTACKSPEQSLDVDNSDHISEGTSEEIVEEGKKLSVLLSRWFLISWDMLQMMVILNMLMRKSVMKLMMKMVRE